MSGNFQEDFHFLLKNLNDKNDHTLSKLEEKENILRTKRALINVINIYITDFDKQYDSVLTPLFHMIELYVKQQTELFISTEYQTSNQQTAERDFTNFLMSRMLLILSNPDTRSLHSYSRNIVVLILEKFSVNNQYEFFSLITELIFTLEDLNTFDKEFYDKNEPGPNVLNRFLIGASELSDDSREGSLSIGKKPILIESPSYCYNLQENITYILREVSFQFISILHLTLYDKLWTLLCEQLKWSDRNVKISSYQLILCILDIRVLPLNRFDMSNENYLYFMDCLIGTFDMLCSPETFTSSNDDSEMIVDNETLPASGQFQEENQKLVHLISLIVNRLFNNNQVFLRSLNDVNQLLIQLVDLVKRGNFNMCSPLLANSLFSMIYNLIELKLHSNESKYLDLCLLSDLAESLVGFIGRMNKVNTFLNLIIAKGLIYEIEMQRTDLRDGELKTKKEVDKQNENVSEMTLVNNQIFRLELDYDRIQTKLYKNLGTRARQILQSIKSLAPNTQEFKIKSNGLNSIFEIFSFACIMSQNDPIILEEYRNPLIESCKTILFTQPTSATGDSGSGETVFLNLLLFWVALLNDPRNQTMIDLIYFHALNTIKNIYLSSIEWKRGISQNLVTFLSIPWLSTETNGLDLDLFKDKSYKQTSINLSSQASHLSLKQIKLSCIQLLCLLPKNVSPQWRTQVMSRCVRDEPDDNLRRCALKYLPYLIYSLGVSANSLVFQLIHPAMTKEKSPEVLQMYARMLTILCCLISRKCILVRKIAFQNFYLIKSEDDVENDWLEMSEYFDMMCTCCDKTQIDMQILPKMNRRKNQELFHTLYNRPKYVDAQILIQFFLVLNGTKGSLANGENNNISNNKIDTDTLPASSHLIQIRSELLKNLERVFNHVEFARKLDAQTLVSVDMMDAANLNSASSVSTVSSVASSSSNSNSANLTYIFRETMNLLADETLDSIIRFDFSRISISKLISHYSLNQSVASSHHHTDYAYSKRTVDKHQLIMDEDTANAMQQSVYSLSSHTDPQLNHNFNLENQLCEGFINAQNSKNLFNMYLFIVGLGRFALSMTQSDEYVFVCVKHLLEIIDSNQSDVDEYALLARSLAHQQLIVISKKINMKVILDEFEEEVCEILANTIFNTITRSTTTGLKKHGSHSYLQEANQALKNILKIFNCIDSIVFVRNYQRYLVPFLTYKATIEGTNLKTITRSLELLSRKMYSNSNVSKLIEDNFIYILAYTTIHSNALVVQVLRYITDEIVLDIDKLINFNKQRTLSELLTKCGNPRYKPQIWQAIAVLTAVDDEEARRYTIETVEDSRIIKATEPSLLAVLVYFDLVLIKSTFNIKEKCLVLESLNLLMGLLGPQVITKVRHKLMTTLKLAMQQCSKFTELNCKLWDTFLRNVEKSAIGPVLNQISVNLLQLLDSQPYKVSKIFEYLIIQNKDYLHTYFNELYFIPESYSCLQQVNQTLRKYTDTKFIFEHSNSTSFLTQSTDMNAAVNLRALIYSIKQYIRGSQHENADLRVKALEKLYSLFKEKSAQIIFLIERQENCQIVSEIVIALLNGCRDSDPRAKLLFGSCLGEIGAIDPAYIMATSGSSGLVSVSSANSTIINSSFSTPSVASNAQLKKSNTTQQALNQSNQVITPSASASVMSTSTMMSPTDLLMNSSLVSEDSNEFSENFAHSLIIELSKAYLAASNTHEQDSASYAIQECLKIYGCSSTSSKQLSNIKLWNSFPDYYKEILVPLQTSKYEIHSYDNLGALKTPIILNESSTYEEWVYKWCAYLISKIGTHFSTSNNSNDVLGSTADIIDVTNCSGVSTDKELRVFPKLQFITRFNVNVAFFILPYVIIKMIIQSSSNEIIEQIFEEIMSVIQLRMLIEKKNASPNKQLLVQTSSMKSSHKKILQYHHICCQTVFNIYDHLVRQLNYYRTKMTELQSMLNIKSRSTVNSKQSSVILMGSNARHLSANEILLAKYRDLFEAFNRFIQRIPQQIISKAAFECKAYCRSLMHYELFMKQTPGAMIIQGSTINIKQEHLVELQNLYASMDEIDAASGILALKKGTEEGLVDAAFRHKINGRLNESIACIEQMLESNDIAKGDIKQHENYVRSFMSIGKYRNALSYLQGLMVDKPDWKEALDSYRIEACWKLGSWDKLKQIINSNSANNRFKPSLGGPEINSASINAVVATTAAITPNNSKNTILNPSLTFNSSTFNMLNGKENLLTYNSFNAGIGKLFALVTERNEIEFQETLSVLREQQLGPLSAASLEAGGNAYQRGYEYVVNLQALQEIESGLSEMLRLRNDTTDKEQYRNMLVKNLDSYLIEPWEHRVQTMQPAFKHLEPIYNVRIAILNFLSSHLNMNLSKQMAKLWLRLAKIARKAGMFENAYQYMLNAQGLIKTNDSNNLEELLVEKSKWYWQREDKDSALFYLQKGLNELFGNETASSNSSSTNYTLNNELYSKVLLMYTKYSEENGSIDSETLRKNYLEVQKMRKNTEQAHFELAQFTDRLATSVSENVGKKEKFWEFITEVVSYYALSLEHGCQYIYQSLPRMITLWDFLLQRLDFGADFFDHQCREMGSSSSSGSRSSTSMSSTSRNLSQLNNILVKLNSTISNALQKIPTYAFLTVYPQLVSRICHPEERVFETLSNILMKVFFLYPCQAIWMLIAVKNSSVDLRKNRCKVIMDKVVRQQPDLKKFITDSSELAEKLVSLGNMNVDNNVTQLSLASYFRPLKKLVESRDFSKILIPSQFQVTLQLPTNESGNNLMSGGVGGSTAGSSSSTNNQNFRSHNPYPLELVYISCFEDNVVVMSSLQKPKKVTIRGTDGKLYPFLCKAKDDLRIDYRIMEFFSVVNKCLKQEPEARRRNLYIRTYAVTPLNENSGIIEWIENLSTLRSILQKLYAERGVNSIGSSEWKMHEEKVQKDKEYALKVFRQFLDRYRPTVLYEWFVRTFSEPNSWYNARLNYVRTAAVMSVCGYVLGLGDRHCENILMASSNGDCIHVDFNCLFNKGETLGVPEIVPFRLTHNMIEAMGPLGHEGIYRKICEVSLKILRDYRDPLITILKTFIYDPLVEWKTPANYRTNESGETVSAKGQIHLQNITCRLKGMHTKAWVTANSRVKSLPLSVEGHVSTLIKEATDDRNLSQMYIGWSAYF